MRSPMPTNQMELFPVLQPPPEVTIPGLSYFANYISSEYAGVLLAAIDQHAWLSDLKRRVQHYGYKYDYKARTINTKAYLGPMPSWAAEACRKLKEDGILPVTPDQVIVNEYLPGQGISAHIDCVPCFNESIASLSLGSPCVMEFTREATGEKQDILLRPESLITLSGPARYEWQHAIPARKSDIIDEMKVPRERRVSLTFRKVILEPC